MSVGSLFSIGTSALRAAYTQLQVTGHNIANVNTDGYSRQEVQLATTTPNYTGGGFIGRGVDVQTVVRQYDAFRAAELRASTATAAGDELRAQQLGQLEALFANGEFGVGAALDDLSAAFGDLAARPFDTSARAAVLARADAFAERVRNLSSQLDAMVDESDSRLQIGVASVNDALSRIAELNEGIARGFASGQPPNDLMDQRDTLLRQINEKFKTTSYQNPDGTISVFTAGGQSLVVGGAVARLSTAPDPLDAAKLQVVLTTNGRDVPLDSAALGPGELSSLLRFRDQDLQAARTGLGQIAAAVAYAYNDQQATGLDPSGAPGAPLFATPQPRVNAAPGNTGSAAFSTTVADAAALKASDYEIAWDGSAYTVTRQSDGARTTVGAWPAVIDGLSIGLSGGAPQPGDRFLLRSGSVFAANFGTTGIAPSRLATALPAMPAAMPGNAGDVAARDFRIVGSDPNVGAEVVLTFDGAGAFTVTGPGTGGPVTVPYSEGMTVSYNGWSMRLTGTPAANDRIRVAAPADPAADNRNARAMLGLGDAAIVDGRRVTDAYANLLADLGMRSQGAKASAELSGQTLADARAALGSVSGVNLDEEAARLLQYQQAYQAAAKVMAAAQAAFDTLLEVSR